jgi:frataxin-like iron-binding protein CyaY
MLAINKNNMQDNKTRKDRMQKEKKHARYTLANGALHIETREASHYIISKHGASRVR